MRWPGVVKRRLISKNMLHRSQWVQVARKLLISINRQDSAKQTAHVHYIENMTPETPKLWNILWKNTLALVTGMKKVLESDRLHYAILARQETATSKLTCQHLPKTEMVLVPTDDPVTTRTPAAPQKIGFAHSAVFSGLHSNVRCKVLRYSWAVAEWYTGTNVLWWFLGDMSSTFQVKRLLKSWRSGGNVPTSQCSLPISISLICRCCRRPYQSTFKLSLFTCLLF